jgi:hypothetical protein
VEQTELWRGVAIVSDSKIACHSNLKFLIRKGIPDVYRTAIWRGITGCGEFLKKDPEFYKEHLTRVFGRLLPKYIFKRMHNNLCHTHTHATGLVTNMRSFLGYAVPSFGGYFEPESHFLTEEGVSCAKRILCTIAMENPQIEYMPQLNDLGRLLQNYFIVGSNTVNFCLKCMSGSSSSNDRRIVVTFLFLTIVVCILLHFLSEADTYTSIVLLLKQNFTQLVASPSSSMSSSASPPPSWSTESSSNTSNNNMSIGIGRGYFPFTKRGSTLFLYTFDSLIEKHIPKLAARM